MLHQILHAFRLLVIRASSYAICAAQVFRYALLTDTKLKLGIISKYKILSRFAISACTVCLATTMWSSTVHAMSTEKSTVNSEKSQLHQQSQSTIKQPITKTIGNEELQRTYKKHNDQRVVAMSFPKALPFKTQNKTDKKSEKQKENLRYATNSKHLAHDKELIESSHCARFFDYFEKKYRLPQNLLHAISLTETGRKHSKIEKLMIPWAWTANVEGKGYYFNSKKEAVKFVEEQLASGKRSIDIGCAQVNLKHHPHAFENVEAAFDPKNNLEYAAKLLRNNYEQSSSWDKAIAHYHSATEALGSSYYKRVSDFVKNIHIHKIPYTQRVSSFASRTPRYIESNRVLIPIVEDSKRRTVRKRSDIMVYIPTPQQQQKQD